MKYLDYLKYGALIALVIIAIALIFAKPLITNCGLNMPILVTVSFVLLGLYLILNGVSLLNKIRRSKSKESYSKSYDGWQRLHPYLSFTLGVLVIIYGLIR